MTVQNNMAVFMMQGGLGELKAVTEKTAASKNTKAESFNEALKTADCSNAATDGFEKIKNVRKQGCTSEKQYVQENAESDGHSPILKSVLKEVISGNEETFTEEDAVMTEEVLALLQTLLQNVSEQLQEILGMSEEQLDLAVSELGMNEMDLLNLGNITELVVGLKADGDFSELISNEELHNEVTSLLSTLEAETADIAEKMGLTGEQLEQAIDKALASIDAAAEDFLVTDENVGDVAALDMQGVKETLQTGSAGKTENKNEASQDSESRNSGMLFQNVISNLEQSVADVAEEPQSVQIVRQVIEQIQINAREDVTSMEIMLTPEELGKVNLSVTAKNGTVTAQITTDTLAAKEAIEAQINVLRESLNEQGIKIEAVEVTVESHKFEANSEHNREPQQEEPDRKRRYINLEGAEEVQFEDTAAVLAREIMMSNGNRMDIVT